MATVLEKEFSLQSQIESDKKIFFLLQLSSVTQSCLTLCNPWTEACQASLSITQGTPKLISIESVMPSNHLIICHPFLLLPSIFPSIRMFSNELTPHIRWPEWSWSFSFSINPSNEYPGLISFRIDWFDLLAVQGTLESSNSKLASLFSSCG